MMKKTLYALALASVLWGRGEACARDVFMAPHEAQYSLSLHKVNETVSNIIDARGSMSYSFSQDCDGWITETSIMMDIVFDNGAARTFIWNLSSFEAMDGSSYSFSLEDFSDENNPRTYVGNASFDYEKGRATVTFSKPEGMPDLPLPFQTIFPVALYKSIIRTANDGKMAFSASYFDGSSPLKALSASTFTTIVPNLKTADITGDTGLLDKEKLLSSSVAFFADGETPEFEIKILLYNNGIVRELVQNIGTIDVKGQLVEVKAKKIPVCTNQPN